MKSKYDNIEHCESFDEGWRWGLICGVRNCNNSNSTIKYMTKEDIAKVAATDIIEWVVLGKDKSKDGDYVTHRIMQAIDTYIRVKLQD